VINLAYFVPEKLKKNTSRGKIQESADCKVSKVEIGQYWRECFSRLCTNSFGDGFRTLRELELESIEKTIRYYKADLDPVDVSQMLFDYWVKPDIFPDAKEFYENINIPVCILSNIDRQDIVQAIEYHETSDVFGAQRLGIKAVWLNRKHKKRKKDIFPDMEIKNLVDLCKRL